MSFLIKGNIKTPKIFTISLRQKMKIFVIKNSNIHAIGDSGNNLSIVKSIYQDIICEKFKINSNTWLQKSKHYSDN